MERLLRFVDLRILRRLNFELCETKRELNLERFEDFELRLTFEFQRKETADFGEICKIRGFEDSELRPIVQTKF